MVGDPIDLNDPLGLWVPPSIPDPVYNFATGIADSLSYGIGPLLRNEYGISGPDQCSTAYKVGEYTSLALGVSRLAYAGVARGLAAAAAAAARNAVKQFFRGPFAGLNYKIYTYEQLLQSTVPMRPFKQSLAERVLSGTHSVRMLRQAQRSIL